MSKAIIHAPHIDTVVIEGFTEVCRFDTGTLFYSGVEPNMKLIGIAPVIGKGQFKFQPIFINDLVDIVLDILRGPKKDNIIEIGGSCCYVGDAIFNMTI